MKNKILESLSIINGKITIKRRDPNSYTLNQGEPKRNRSYRIKHKLKGEINNENFKQLHR